MDSPPKNPNRIDSTAAPATEPDPPLHPFTQPMVPAGLLPWAAAIVGIAAAIQTIIPAGTVAATVCGIVVSLGLALGIISNGIKKKVE